MRPKKARTPEVRTLIAARYDVQPHLGAIQLLERETGPTGIVCHEEFGGVEGAAPHGAEFLP